MIKVDFKNNVSMRAGDTGSITVGLYYSVDDVKYPVELQDGIDLAILTIAENDPIMTIICQKETSEFLEGQPIFSFVSSDTKAYNGIYTWTVQIIRGEEHNIIDTVIPEDPEQRAKWIITRGENPLR